jgi:DNA-binding NarL/FixJ family response regulator
VDDFEGWRQMVCRLVDNSPDMVLVDLVSDGLEAVLRAEALQPDLIILDLNLPSLNGINACRRIRELCQRTKVLILSLNSDQDVVRAAFGAGADGYVLKTDAYRQLLEGARTVVAGRKFVSSGLAAPHRRSQDPKD